MNISEVATLVRGPENSIVELTILRNNEKIVNIPSDPIRDGYEFKGWYKEKECINKWDFNNDIVPLKEYDSNNEYIFKETSLYAKWERR